MKTFDVNVQFEPVTGQIFNTSFPLEITGEPVADLQSEEYLGLLLRYYQYYFAEKNGNLYLVPAHSDLFSDSTIYKIITTYDYQEVSPEYGDNPAAKGWYEYNETEDKYILTRDQWVDYYKTYYERIKQESVSQYSIDTSVLPRQKTYLNPHTQTEETISFTYFMISVNPLIFIPGSGSKYDYSGDTWYAYEFDLDTGALAARYAMEGHGFNEAGIFDIHITNEAYYGVHYMPGFFALAYGKAQWVNSNTYFVGSGNRTVGHSAIILVGESTTYPLPSGGTITTFSSKAPVAYFVLDTSSKKLKLIASSASDYSYDPETGSFKDGADYFFAPNNVEADGWIYTFVVSTGQNIYSLVKFRKNIGAINYFAGNQIQYTVLWTNTEAAEMSSTEYTFNTLLWRAGSYIIWQTIGAGGGISINKRKQKYYRLNISTGAIQRFELPSELEVPYFGSTLIKDFSNAVIMGVYFYSNYYYIVANKDDYDGSSVCLIRTSDFENYTPCARDHLWHVVVALSSYYKDGSIYIVHATRGGKYDSFSDHSAYLNAPELARVDLE